MDRRQDIEELARTFLSAMGLSLEIAVDEQEDHYRLDLEGSDAYLLLEKKGAGLEAFQLLLAKVADKKLGLDKRLVVDCEGHRRSREEEIVQLALRAADKARKSGQPIHLDPMNSYERRLVHLALAEVAGVESHSQGEGHLKTVVVIPV